MKSFILILISLLVLIQTTLSQERRESGSGIMFRGLVIDAATLSPIPNSQIYINNSMTGVSSSDGSFTFYVNRSDTVVFNSLGYKQTRYLISDTLRGREFNAGIFMSTDTVEIGEVIIIPRQSTLRYEIMNAPPRTPSIMDNAKSNVAVSAYQGRTTQSQLGDPMDNYAVISQQQKTMAYEKGGIPSDQTVALNPFILIPAAYLLIKGLPEKPAPMKSLLTPAEVDQIHRKYLETKRKEAGR
ncbi:MAG TPA: hypothetical protein VMV47_01295 [Bacteroidales bacterium]|nr:hypothetical protein [Bacteroidales bacterium]